VRQTIRSNHYCNAYRWQYFHGPRASALVEDTAGGNLERRITSESYEDKPRLRGSSSQPQLQPGPSLYNHLRISCEVFTDPFLRGISSQPQWHTGQEYCKFCVPSTQLGTGAMDHILENASSDYPDNSWTPDSSPSPRHPHQIQTNPSYHVTEESKNTSRHRGRQQSRPLRCRKTCHPNRLARLEVKIYSSTHSQSRVGHESRPMVKGKCSTGEDDSGAQPLGHVSVSTRVSIDPLALLGWLESAEKCCPCLRFFVAPPPLPLPSSRA